MALDFFAGCVGGIAGCVVGHPLDTVKVRMQTQSSTNLKYTGTFHCLSTIARKESISGLYKGISSPIVSIAGVNALVFGIYGYLRPSIAQHPANDALWAHFLAGSVTGAVQSILTSPMELVKTRMQLNEESGGVGGNKAIKKVNAWEVLKGIYNNEGGIMRGLGKGWTVTLFREIPAFGTYFYTYEALTTKRAKDHIGTFDMLMAGGTAGVFSWLISFPLDVVKTRYQSDSQGKYKGPIDCARQTLKAEGYSAFTRGLGSTVLRAFPTNAACFTVVMWTMRLFENRETSQENLKSQNNKKKIRERNLEELLGEWNKLQNKLKLNFPSYNLLSFNQNNQNLIKFNNLLLKNEFGMGGNKIFAFNQLVKVDHRCNKEIDEKNSTVPSSTSLTLFNEKIIEEGKQIERRQIVENALKLKENAPNSIITSSNCQSKNKLFTSTADSNLVANILQTGTPPPSFFFTESEAAQIGINIKSNNIRSTVKYSKDGKLRPIISLYLKEIFLNQQMRFCRCLDQCICYV